MMPMMLMGVRWSFYSLIWDRHYVNNCAYVLPFNSFYSLIWDLKNIADYLGGVVSKDTTFYSLIWDLITRDPRVRINPSRLSIPLYGIGKFWIGDNEYGVLLSIPLYGIAGWCGV